MSVDGNGGPAVNYEPNSFNGPQEDPNHKEHSYDINGKIGRYRYTHPNDDFAQPRALYEKVMDAPQKERLINAIAGHMKQVPREDIKIRALKVFYRVHPELGTRLCQAVGVQLSKVKSNL